MIDHISLPVSDLAKSAAFYEALLTPLGYRKLIERDANIGFGKAYPELWLNHRDEVRKAANPGCHICLRARSEDAVRAFHEAAVANGGTDDGAPGPRQGAFTTYFGAFIIDPDGNKLEAVTFPRAEG
jgi:catechol 2,3-dioxygenase-like lactoylglutathione lyase family enzyme